METRLKFVPNWSSWHGAGSGELQLQLGAAQGAECGSQGKPSALGHCCVQEPLCIPMSQKASLILRPDLLKTLKQVLTLSFGLKDAKMLSIKCSGAFS